MTEKLAAVAEGFYSDFSTAGNPDPVICVAEPDDDNDTFILRYQANNRSSFTLAASAIPAGSTINSVTVHGRLATSEPAEGDYVKQFIRLGGVDVDGPVHTVGPAAADDWRNFDDVLARPGGGLWTIADLATLEIGVAVAVPNFWADCTTLFAVIDYTPGGGPTPSGDMLLCMA